LIEGTAHFPFLRGKIIAGSSGELVKTKPELHFSARVIGLVSLLAY
jgi:hypothetical protein